MLKLKNLYSSFHLIGIFFSAFLIVLFSYLLLKTFHLRFDLSPGRIYSLSEQTKQILKALQDEPISVFGFFPEDDSAKGELRDLLKEYAYHHGKLRFEFYDPDRMPAKVKQYGVGAYGTVVIEAKGQRQTTRQVGEEAITNLLSRILRSEKKSVVFAMGYGGPIPDEEKEKPGYGQLRQKLTDSNYEVKTVILPQDEIPDGTHVLIIGGPHVDLMPRELEIVRKFVDSGGGVLIMMDPVDLGEGKQLEGLLLEYGIQLGHDVVVDKLSKLFGADYLIPMVTQYGSHPITRGFQFTSFLSVARSVRKADVVPENLEVTEMALTGSGSWAETNLKELEKGIAEFKEGEDQRGPVPVAVAISKKGGNGRLVVFGDSEFVTNAYFNLSGNKDLILNTIAWLAGDEFSITIRPRTREAAPLYLKETDQAFLFIVPVLGLPVFSLAVGAGIFFWRRRFH